MKPINDQMGNYNFKRSSGGQTPSGGSKGILGIIVFIIMLVLYFSNSGNDTESGNTLNTVANMLSSTNGGSNLTSSLLEGYDFTKPSNYADSSSLDLFNMLYGGSSSSSSSSSTSSNQNYTSYEDGTIKNSASDTYTLMVYMCGSNLESDGGYASADIATGTGTPAHDHSSRTYHPG